MKIIHERSIILKKYPLHDADTIVILFCENYGILKATVKKNIPFFNTIQPFNEIESTINFKGYDSLSVIKVVEVVNFFDVEKKGIENYYLASFLAEIILKSIFERESFNKKIFSLFSKILNLKRLSNTEKKKIAIYSLFWILKLEGIIPPISKCSICKNTISGKIFMDKKINFYCLNCVKKPLLDATFLREFLSLPPEKLLEKNLDIEDKLQVILKIFTHKIEDFLKKNVETKKIIF